MNVFDVILTTEVISGILIIGALVMAVRSILMFTRQANEMAPKLQKIEMGLAKQREGMAEKKQVVKDLHTVVDPLRSREGKLREYYESLKKIEIDHERESAQESEREESERRKRVQRKKMGFD